jgi:hypothetical protein
VKHWPIRNRLALWTGILLAVELVTRKALQPLQEVAVAAEKIDAKARRRRGQRSPCHCLTNNQKAKLTKGPPECELGTSVV